MVPLFGGILTGAALIGMWNGDGFKACGNLNQLNTEGKNLLINWQYLVNQVWFFIQLVITGRQCLLKVYFGHPKMIPDRIDHS